jgi:hypothetical protein
MLMIQDITQHVPKLAQLTTIANYKVNYPGGLITSLLSSKSDI